MFIWGCVYQCHGSHDRNKPTFGSGSLFSIRRIIGDYFQFDTNIRYLKTYVCEEHDFARRVQQGGAKIILAETVKANHYQAPSQNRPWRGLGGDFNYLYDQMKREDNSISMYYYSLFLGVILTIKNSFKKHDSNQMVNKYHLHEAVLMFKNILVLIKQKKLVLATKCFFYAIIDIPVRAKLRSKNELKKSKEFSLLATNVMTTS
jgi:GT2 family glycosyltransferase